MNNRISKSLVLGVVVLFLCVSFAPVMNAISIPKNIVKTTEPTVKNEERHNMSALFCKVNIDSIQKMVWLPGAGLFIATNGTVSVEKAFILYDVDTDETQYFDSFHSTGDAVVILHGFFFRKSSEPNQMEGFAWSMSYELGNGSP